MNLYMNNQSFALFFYDFMLNIAAFSYTPKINSSSFFKSPDFHFYWLRSVVVISEDSGLVNDGRFK